MSQIFDITTLITIAIAVFILLRLRSVLGKRTGHQPPPGGPYRVDRQSGANKQAEAGNDNVVTLSDRGARKKGKDQEELPAAAEINAYAKSGTKLNRGLKEIARHDAGFAPEGFLNGARMAYEMIVTAFADGDRKALKGLLSREVYDGFAASISQRENRKEKLESTFVGIEKAAITAADVTNNDAHVTVNFVSQIISATFDSEGELIDGDPDQVAEVNDIWTFARDVRSRDPNWKLVATESEG